MSRFSSPILLWCAAVLALAGCTPIKPPGSGKSPLLPARMSPQSSVLDLFFVRCPFNDPKLNQALWSEVDEQPFPAAQRLNWTRNGFRVGVVVGKIPATLAQLMDLKDASTPRTRDDLKQDVDFQSDARVVMRHLQIRPGQRTEVICSGIYEELPMLLCEPDQVSGQTYRQAQALWGAKTRDEPDGRLRLELVPEIQHGNTRVRYTGDQGVLRVEAGRARRVFDAMTVVSTLAPGQMLVLTSLPNRPGSLGHYFFTDKHSGPLEQKLLVVRLTQTQHNSLLETHSPSVLNIAE
jgi:hypothetical protein